MRPVLHFCVNFTGNTLYKELISRLSRNEPQIVYAPIQLRNQKNKNKIKKNNVLIFYDHCYKWFFKLCFFLKIQKYTNNAQNFCNQKRISPKIIHAHTLFSDGGAAFKLYKITGRPYIITIRNSDLNIFYKYFIFHREYIHNVLKEAACITFVSKAYKKKFFQIILNQPWFKHIKKRCFVIPNGLAQDFMQIPSKQNWEFPSKKNLKLITISSLDKNKNILTLIRLIKLLQSKKIKATLEIIGKGSQYKRLFQTVKTNNLTRYIKFFGFCSRKKIIQRLRKNHIFILVSLHETFGISYFEAAAAGLPIIYTKNEGIDGFFRDGKIGYRCSPKNINEQYKKILLIVKKYGKITKEFKKHIQQFSWEKVARQYQSLYYQAELKNPKK